MTLVEVLVALVVFLFISLALMQTALVSIDANMVSALREEAVRIAEQRMNDARSLPFTSQVDKLSTASDSSAPANCPSAAFLASFPAGVSIKRDIRQMTGPNAFPFCTNMTVTLIPNTSSASIAISVGWKWKGQDYRHSISTVRGRDL
jgi:type II secretory pathway pseudopilin PulG